MSTREFDSLEEPLEPWEDLASRLQNERWRGEEEAAQRQVTTHPGPQPIPGLPVLFYGGGDVAPATLHQLAHSMGLAQLVQQLTATRREVAELRAWKQAHEREHPTMAPLAPQEHVAVFDAVSMLAALVGDSFGKAGRVELDTNDDVDSDRVPYVIRVDYGIAGEVSDDQWVAHTRIIEKYASEVAASVRRRVRLDLTTG